MISCRRPGGKQPSSEKVWRKKMDSLLKKDKSRHQAYSIKCGHETEGLSFLCSEKVVVKRAERMAITGKGKKRVSGQRREKNLDHGGKGSK